MNQRDNRERGKFEKPSCCEKMVIFRELRKFSIIGTQNSNSNKLGNIQKGKEKYILNMQKTWDFILKGQEIAYKF